MIREALYIDCDHLVRIFDPVVQVGDLVVYLVLRANFPEIELHSSLSQPRSVGQREFALDIAEPAVAPRRRDGHKHPSQNIEQERYRLCSDQRSHHLSVQVCNINGYCCSEHE